MPKSKQINNQISIVEEEMPIFEQTGMASGPEAKAEPETEECPMRENMREFLDGIRRVDPNKKINIAFNLPMRNYPRMVFLPANELVDIASDPKTDECRMCKAVRKIMGRMSDDPNGAKDHPYKVVCFPEGIHPKMVAVPAEVLTKTAFDPESEAEPETKRKVRIILRGAENTAADVRELIDRIKWFTNRISQQCIRCE